MVRLAKTEADLWRCAELYKPEGVYAEIAYDPTRAVSMAKKALEKGSRMCAVMSEQDGDVTGFLFGAVAPHFFSPVLAANTMFWYVTPPHRGGITAVKLLHAFKQWSKQQGAERIYMPVTSGLRLKQTDHTLKRLGYQVIGGNYMQALR